MANEPGETTDDGPAGRNVAEWVVLIASALIVAGLVGLAIYEYVIRDEPPGVRISVEVHVDQAQERDGAWYVPFSIHNNGAEPAQSVVVSFSVIQGDQVMEESTTEFAFLPNGGSAKGELVTTLDPASHEFKAAIASIQVP